MTERERICLLYLSEKMEATAAMIGRAVYDQASSPGGSNLSAIGAAIVGRLCKRGLVTHIPELNAWRISAAGRELLDSLRK